MHWQLAAALSQNFVYPASMRGCLVAPPCIAERSSRRRRASRRCGNRRAGAERADDGQRLAKRIERCWRGGQAVDRRAERLVTATTAPSSGPARPWASSTSGSSRRRGGRARGARPPEGEGGTRRTHERREPAPRRPARPGGLAQGPAAARRPARTRTTRRRGTRCMGEGPRDFRHFASHAEVIAAVRGRRAASCGARPGRTPCWPTARRGARAAAAPRGARLRHGSTGGPNCWRRATGGSTCSTLADSLNVGVAAALATSHVLKLVAAAATWWRRRTGARRARRAEQVGRVPRRGAARGRPRRRRRGGAATRGAEFRGHGPADEAHGGPEFKRRALPSGSSSTSP